MVKNSKFFLEVKLLITVQEKLIFRSDFSQEFLFCHDGL